MVDMPWILPIIITELIIMLSLANTYWTLTISPAFFSALYKQELVLSFQLPLSSVILLPSFCR